MRNTLRVLLSIMYRTKGYDHVNIHVWFLVSVSRSSRRRHGRRTHPFRIRTCARCARQVVVFWTCRLPRSRARGGRGGRRGVSAHAVTRPFSQLYGVRLQDRLPPCTSKICVRSPGRSSSVGPSGSPRPRICVCVPKWMVSRPFTELLTVQVDTGYR